MSISNNNSAIEPVILAVETSGRCGSVALVTPGQTIGEYSLDTKSTHSRRLLTGIDWIMKEAALTWGDIGAVAISLGPGSFTGLRIGLSTVKGIVMAAGKKMIGVPTLDGLAHQLPYVSQLICPVIDARKKEIYTAFFRYSASRNTIERISDYRAITPEKLAAEITEPTIFIGDGIAVYGELLKNELADLALFPPPEIFFARAAAIGNIGLRMFQNNEFIDPATSTPIYIRKSDAELNFGKPGSK